MVDSYIGEIRIFAGTFAPNGWLFCDGSLQPISQYDTLFNLIGTTYGGDGQSTFGLPDLRGRVPVHQGNLAGGSSYQIGQKAGAETVTLSWQQIAAHSHPVYGTSTSPSQSPQNAVFAVVPGGALTFFTYSSVAPNTALNQNSVSAAPLGANQPHPNIQPSIGLNFIISMFGIYPSPS